MRDGVKAPGKFARIDVEGADITGRARKCFRDGAAQNDLVFKHDTGAARADRNEFRGTVETLPKIEPPVIAKTHHRFTGDSVQSPKEVPVSEEDPVTVQSYAAMAISSLALGLVLWIEAPDFPSRSSIKSNHTQLRRGCVQHAVHYDGVALHLRAFEIIV